MKPARAQNNPRARAPLRQHPRVILSSRCCRRGEGIALAPTESDYRVMSSLGVAPSGLVLALALVCTLQPYTALVWGCTRPGYTTALALACTPS